ncbi:uncharacterized protein LOC143750007 isoform X2 [Siphateles boraxobius]|uniref:uncharacterized protein LOC143750007 isoform X2 n=1 Tax=Siphateles boraxobius TaxID=180520 RepID=UPI0040632920
MTQKTDRGARQMKTDDIYENADSIRRQITRDKVHSIATRLQPPELTGSDSVRNKSSRAAAVCLVLLCVLLLTAVIVLCVHIHTKSTNYTEERDQLLTNNTRLTEERDQLLTNNTRLTEERDQLLTNNTRLTEERDQLLTNITRLTEERDQLIFKNGNLTNEINQLLTNITNLTEERDGLRIKNNNVTNERDQLRNELIILGGWTYYKSSFYYMPSEKKNWTESRRDCRERGADLIIINNTEEQDFVKNMTGSAIVWIGLTDSDVDGTWKWVDESTLTSGNQTGYHMFLLKSRSPFEETTNNNLTFNTRRLNMSFYGNMNFLGKHGMDREDEEEMNIYANTDPINSFDGRTETENSETKRHQTPQHTGSDSVRNKSSRAAAVCLVLLCVLLLTAVIVLYVHIHTKSTNYTEELLLLTNNTNLTEERAQLLTNNTRLTEERDQLLTNNTRLTEERDQLLTNNTRLTEERDQLLTNNTRLKEERDQLLTNNTRLTEERDQLLKILCGWTYYKSSFYYMPSEKKSWTESRRDCRERGADLIIINNREEQDFVKNMTGSAIVYIGLTDSVVENTWKWVDGSTLTSGFWASGEPNGGRRENCVVTVAVPTKPEWGNRVGWLDVECTKAFQWICERSISQLTQQ